jgi:hypothetical protein
LSTTSATSSGADSGYPQTPLPKRGLWKWSLTATATILVFLTWQCGSALVQGRKLANSAVWHFHQQLNAEEYEEIYRSADEGFKAGQSHDEVIKFLQVVHKKLGSAGDATQTNIRVDTNTHGTFTTTWYSTAFVNGAAKETFTWTKRNGTLKLYGYHIESNALLAN